MDRQGRRRPDEGAARVHAARPQAVAVAGGRLGLDRRPARAHDPERRRQRAGELGGAAQARAEALQQRCCRCAARARSRRSRRRRASSRRRPAARARTSASASSARSKFLQGPEAAGRDAGRRDVAGRAPIRGGSDAWAIRGSGKRSWLFTRPAARLRDPRAVRRVRGARARARRPRRHRAGPAGRRHRPQRPHRVGRHQRPLRRRRPLRREARRATSATASRARSRKMDCRDRDGSTVSAARRRRSSAHLPHRPRPGAGAAGGASPTRASTRSGAASWTPSRPRRSSTRPTGAATPTRRSPR